MNNHPQTPEHRRECALNFGECYKNPVRRMPLGFENKKVNNKPHGTQARDSYGSSNV
jgi:hypothetical protein